MDLNINNKPFTFTWQAFFLDGSILNQFENGIENKFQLVKDKFDKLIKFSLLNQDHSQCFTIDLELGIIIYNNCRNINLEVKEKKNNVRLIYFRRHKVQISERDLKEQSHAIEYHLGFQYLDSNNFNHQIILEIDEQGNFIIN